MNQYNKQNIQLMLYYTYFTGKQLHQTDFSNPEGKLMKAIVYKKYGSADVLKLKEIEKPVPRDSEILVKIHAATVNRTDCATIKAKPFFMRLVTGIFKPKKTVPGSDFAGVVEDTGNKVSLFKIGDRVLGFNDMGLSSHAQYLTVSEKSAVSLIPDKSSFEEAAASCEGAHYAINFINKVNIKKGDKVLVNGATGAIGSAAVQILKYYEADITAVCSAENFDLVKSLGAGKVFDYLNEDFTDSDDKFSFVFDTVGKSSFFKCRQILENRGIYISSELGYMNQNIYLSLFTPLFRKKKVRFPVPVDISGSIELIKKLIENSQFKAVIDRTYPIEQIPEAYRYAASGKKIDNVVITIKG